MRALTWIVLAATALWTGYWWVGATALENSAMQWIAQQPGVISTSGVAVHGIPNRFDLTVSDLVVTDPGSGIILSSPFVQVYAMSWKPWHVIAALPTGQVITFPDQKVTISSDTLRASAEVHPGMALALNQIIAEAHGLGFNSDAGWMVEVDKVLASVAEDATRANTYRLGLEVAQITPDQAFMAALAGTDLPGVAQEIYLDAHASLTAPLNRGAGENKPKLVTLEVDEVRATWGDLRFSAQGTLAAGPDGLAVGEIALKVEGWRKLPPMLAAMGLVKPDIAPTIERAMEVMAAQGSDPEVLQMVLKCADGRMVLGPLPLGPAPQMN